MPNAETRLLSSRQAAWVLLRPVEKLKASEQAWLTPLKAVCHPVVTAHDLAQQFSAMVKQKLGEPLTDWLPTAKASGLTDFRNFAIGLQRDFAAVKAALTLPWSNGPTEGHVHRLKVIKRQMYGRAKFDLLRKRVLLS